MMIDVSPLLLWSPDIALEMMPVDSADSPQARRLAVLVAEVQAAGRDRDVLRALAAWAALLHTEIPREQAGRSALLHAIAAVEALAFRGEHSAALETLLHELAGLAEFTNPAEAAAAALAVFALATMEGVPFTPEQTWQSATELLCVVAGAAGDAADPTIERCAELAYGVLFARRGDVAA